MYLCKNCGCEFEKAKTKGGMGILWIIFMFLSMGLALILWILVRDKKKKVCPVCGCETIVNKELFAKYNKS